MFPSLIFLSYPLKGWKEMLHNVIVSSSAYSMAGNSILHEVSCISATKADNTSLIIISTLSWWARIWFSLSKLGSDDEEKTKNDFIFIKAEVVCSKLLQSVLRGFQWNIKINDDNSINFTRRGFRDENFSFHGIIFDVAAMAKISNSILVWLLTAPICAFDDFLLDALPRNR